MRTLTLLVVLLAVSPVHADARARRDAIYRQAVLADRDGQAKLAERLYAQLVHVPMRSRSATDPSYLIAQRPLRVVPLAPPWSTMPEQLDEQAVTTRLAWLELQRGDAPSAIETLKAAHDGEALYVRALAERRAGRLDAARADAQRATELEPQQPAPRCLLGTIILDEGDTPTAQEELELNGDDPASMVAEAVALFDLGKDDKARAQLVKLVTQDGAIGDAAATDLAALELRAGRLEEAFQVVPEQPLTPTGWLLRALILECREPKLAPAAFRRALDGAPNFVDALVGLARVEEQLGDDQAAMTAATRALQLRPGLMSAMAIRARLYGKAGDTKREAAERRRMRELREKAENGAPAKHSMAPTLPATLG